jgi:hypothetical protein
MYTQIVFLFYILIGLAEYKMSYSKKRMGRKHRKTQKKVGMKVGGWRPKTKSVKSSTVKSYRTKYSVKSNK